MPEAKLTRKLLKQFASSAPEAEIDVFGSLAAAALDTSLDPDEIQSLSAWLGGWADEVIDDDNPVLEDRNAVDFVYSYMMKTIFQMGIPEWLTTETYFIGSIVNVSGVLYKSLTNTNQGNAVTDTNYWERYNPGNGLNPQANAALATRCLNNWELIATAEALFTITGIAYGASIDTWVLVGNNGVSDDLIEYSTDRGSTWTNISAPSTKFIGDVCWSEELSLFVAVCQYLVNGTGVIYTSPDGITWTARNSPITASYYKVTWVAELGLFVAVGATAAPAKAIITSPDGITWTSRTPAVDTGTQFNSVCYSTERGLLVAVGTAFGPPNLATIQTSPDGVTWTARTPTVDSEPASVIWAKELGKFFAVGSVLFTPPAVTSIESRDGITWVASTLPSIGANVVPLALEYIPELGELVVGNNAFAGATNNLQTTRDLVNWTTRTVADVNGAYRIHWSPQQSQALFGGNYTNQVFRSKFVKTFICATGKQS